MSKTTDNDVKITEQEQTRNGIITDSPVKGDNSNETITDNAVKYPNLKPFNPKYSNALSTKEAQERGRLGGIKSGEVRRQKKTMRETLENALKIELSKEKLEELGADIGLMNGETSVLSAIIASTIREAIGGDTKAIQFVRDSIGEQPKTEVVQEVITKDDMALMESLRNSLIDKVM